MRTIHVGQLTTCPRRRCAFRPGRGGIYRTCSRLLAVVVCLAGLPLVKIPASGVERLKLEGHVPEAVARLGLQPLGRLPATNRMHLAIGLPLRNTNELSQLLHALYDPASPQFRQYLTPEQFAEQFGPTRAEYEAVRQFAKNYGLQNHCHLS